jgi:putative transposase
VDHVPIINDVAALVFRYRPSTPECHHRGCTEEALKAVIVEMHAQAMADEPRWRRVEDAAQHEAAARCDDDDLLLVIGGPTFGKRAQHWPLQLDAFTIVGVATPNNLVDEVRVRLDKKATSISLLVVLGVREDGQKVLLAVKNMGGETKEAWRAVLDDLVKRGLRKPELLIVDGGAGLEAALAAIWGDVATQRCTVHKHRNLLANAPERLHDEITADYTDMIYADTPQEVQKRRKAFLRKWWLRHGAVANSLEEAGDRLFTFITLPPSQWKSARTTNAIERLHEEFKRRIKTQTVLPSADTAAMLFWALLASGQIIMRKVDGWQTLSQKPSDQLVDVAA